MEPVNKILNNWGFKKAEVTYKYNVSGRKIVYKVDTENGEVILIGIPTHMDEKIIIVNTKASSRNTSQGTSILFLNPSNWIVNGCIL